MPTLVPRRPVALRWMRAAWDHVGHAQGSEWGGAAFDGATEWRYPFPPFAPHPEEARWDGVHAGMVEKMAERGLHRSMPPSWRGRYLDFEDYWYAQSDFERYPHLLYFDSIVEIFQIVDSADLQEVSRQMLAHTKELARLAVPFYRDAVVQLLRGRGVQLPCVLPHEAPGLLDRAVDLLRDQL
mmetsp:Transcript_59105/g.133668  ORF Transcript_59105/g.133668 Transcript_59105/m.133668 type:complete len:183 (-) Transcript_59105:355-903(-)